MKGDITVAYDHDTDSASRLTKREHFAGLAMQALVSHYGADLVQEGNAILACKYADALLKALEQDNG